MVSISHAVSMPEELWDQVSNYIDEYHVSRSDIFQIAIKNFFKTDKKDIRYIDIALLALVFVIILLLMVVIL